jgi:hypothetical protein
MEDIRYSARSSAKRVEGDSALNDICKIKTRVNDHYLSIGVDNMIYHSCSCCAQHHFYNKVLPAQSCLAVEKLERSESEQEEHADSFYPVILHQGPHKPTPRQ